MQNVPKSTKVCFFINSIISQAFLSKYGASAHVKSEFGTLEGYDRVHLLLG